MPTVRPYPRSTGKQAAGARIAAPDQLARGAEKACGVEGTALIELLIRGAEVTLPARHAARRPGTWAR